MGTLTGTLRETLAQFDPAGQPRTTTEVAADLDLGRRSTYNRLERLVDHDRLETKKVGANGRVWWRPPTAAPATPDWPAAAESLVDDVLDDVEVGIFVLDENFDVAWINEATERYFDIDRAHAIGRDKRRLIDDHLRSVVDDSERFAETVLATYDDNSYTEQFECHVTPGDEREERWLEHRSRPIEAGAYAGGRVELYYDVTERERSERARREEQAAFESLINAVEEYAIFTLDPDGYVQTWNRGAEQIKGYEDDEIVGEHVAAFYTDAAREAGVPERNLAAAAENGSITEEGWRVREDGSRFYATVTITALRDDGDLQGYVKVTRDMTERKRAREEHQLQLAVSRSIAEATSLEAGLQSAMARVCEWSDWAAGQAWVPTEDGNAERLSPSYADSESITRFNEASADFTFGPGEGIPGRVLESGDPVWFPDVSAVPEETYRRTSLAAEAGVKAGLGVPVLVDGEVAVILEFYMSSARRRDDWLIQVVTSIAAELGSLVARKQAEAEVKRQQDLIENVLETSPVGLAVLDDRGSIRRANARAEDLLGLTASEIEGQTYDDPKWDIWDEDREPIGRDEHPVTEVFRTGDPVLGFRHGITLPDGTERWLSSNASPVLDETGEVRQVVVALEDITQLKDQARRLERQRDDLKRELDDVFERIDDAFYALDDEMRFEYVNDRAEELLGFRESELLGRTVWEALSVAADDPLRDRFRTAMATQEPASFERNSEPLGIWELVRIYPSESGLSVYFTEITERKERERELEEYRRWTQTLIENFPSGAVALVDEDLRYVTFGGTPEGSADVSRADLEGRPVREALPERLAEIVVPAYEAALDGNPSAFEETIDDRVYQFHFVPVRDDDGDVFAATAMSQDVTERKEREDLLREAKAQLEAATEAGAVGTWEWHVPDDEFVAGASFARTFGVEPDAARDGVSLDRFLSAIHEDDRERVRRSIDDAVAACGEYGEEYRVENADGEYRWVVARGHVECDDDGNPVTFPGALVDITERKRAERELERQRKQLTAINSLNEVVRDTTAAVIEQSTREEIEETVCERLAATDSYLFAWTGDVDPATRTVALRTEAGVDGYLDGITISVDPDDARSEGPTGRALRTGETQLTHDIRADSRHEPWRSHVEQYEVRSSAAIPLSHEGSVYGVLNVYADRPYAFEGRELEVVGQLGEVVGHAIAAAERKEALQSDELVELDFQVQDVFAAVDAPTETSGTITLDDMVPVEDGEFLVYGTATQDALDTVHRLADVLPHWESVTVVSDDDDPVRFELRVIDPPVLSAVASRGGYVDEAIIEDGDYRMTIHLAPSVDVRQVTDAVEAAYPQAELLRRHQISRPHDESRRLQRRLAADLTDRQRSVLEAAYHAGFFEWPRETTGEQVAESLGIAPPTFHHHLRKAQRKAFDALLSAPIPGPTA